MHVEEFPLPELAPDEAYVAVMASSINFNTVWTSIFEPLPDVRVPEASRPRERVGRAPRPAVPRDGLATPRASCCGSARRCATGSRATRSRCTASTSTTRTRRAHDDSMLATNQRIWGFETNFGGLAEIAVVKANQLMPKPAHLTWEEAACNALCNSTSYRMIVSPNGSQMTQGQTVLVWGASGGIGAYACQYVLNGGGTPVGVVSSPRSAPRCCTRWACEHVIDRRAEGYKFWNDEHTQDPTEWLRLRQEDPRARRRATSTSCSSTRAARRWARRCSSRKRGGMIITCAATSRLHDRVRQPLPLDEPEDAEGLSLRELPRGVGGEPA